MANQGDATNYYEILEVTPDAPSHEIHKAYTRAKSTYSSDNPALYSMFSPDEARELLRLIEEAYLVLGNPGLRRNYDESRAKGGGADFIGAPAQARTNPSASNKSKTTRNDDNSQQTNNTSTAPSKSQSDQAHVVNAHQALPDFPTPPIAEAFGSARVAEPQKAPLPEGTGRTQLSTYKIDDAFENELKNATDFDGMLLQRTRLYKNISIDRLSEATRISRSYLIAVETNDYKNLPAAVFTRGFVVQVARLLGLKENLVATSYIKLFRAGGGK